MKSAAWLATVVAAAWIAMAGCDKKSSAPAPTASGAKESPAASASGDKGRAAPTKSDEPTKPAEPAEPTEMVPSEEAAAEAGAKADEAQPQAGDKAGEAIAEGAKAAETAPKPEVSAEDCAKACDNALKITSAEIKSARKEVRAAIEKKVREDCPKQCEALATPESVACIAKAKNALELASCPR